MPKDSWDDDKISLGDFSGAPKLGEVICLLDDIEEGKAVEFTYKSGEDLLDIFILLKDGEIYGFKNTCPHAGTPLNMLPGKFMERTGKYLMCHTHGALFMPDTGECVGGPCTGSYLTQIAVEVKEGAVIVA
jgi:nitrite reductase/ring-hydroxylating ferredoxin subunit